MEEQHERCILGGTEEFHGEWPQQTVWILCGVPPLTQLKEYSPMSNVSLWTKFTGQ